MSRLETLMRVYLNGVKLEEGDYDDFSILYKGKNLKDKPEELMVSYTKDSKNIILNFKPSENTDLIVRTVLPTKDLKVVHINMNHYDDLISMDEMTLKLAHGISISDILSDYFSLIEEVDNYITKKSK